MTYPLVASLLPLSPFPLPPNLEIQYLPQSIPTFVEGKLKQFYFAIFAFILLSSTSISAQTTDVQPQVSNVFAVLTVALEAKTAHANDEITLNTIGDLFVDRALV